MKQIVFWVDTVFCILQSNNNSINYMLLLLCLHKPDEQNLNISRMEPLVLFCLSTIE